MTDGRSGKMSMNHLAMILGVALSAEAAAYGHREIDVRMGEPSLPDVGPLLAPPPRRWGRRPSAGKNRMPLTPAELAFLETLDGKPKRAFVAEMRRKYKK